MNYVSYEDQINDIRKFIKQLKNEYKMIISIPRSGNIFATMVGLHFNIPVFTITEYKNNILDTSNSMRKNIPQGNKVLVVDDSCNAGLRMKKARQELSQFNDEFEFCCLYSTNGQFVDRYLKKLPQPRVYEWNLFHHDVIGRSCVDIDGVVCEDPIVSDSVDVQAYEDWIGEAKLKNFISHRVGAFVTNRLEKYRPQTEKWLKDHGFQYGQLIMSDYKDPKERARSGAHHKKKANVYATCNAQLFIESDVGQAKKINELTGKPVYCVDNNTMYN